MGRLLVVVVVLFLPPLAIAAIAIKPKPFPRTPPGWSELTRQIVPPSPPPSTVDLALLHSRGGEKAREGGGADAAAAPTAHLLTLYRERNGWCPHSERLWLALEAKGVTDYGTVLVEARGDTYDGAPTGAEERGEDGRPALLDGLGLPQLRLPPPPSVGSGGNPSMGVGYAPQPSVLRSGAGEEDSVALLQELDALFPGSEPLWPPLLADGSGLPACTGDAVAAAVDAYWEAAAGAVAPCGRGPASRAAGLFRSDEGYRLDPLPRAAFEAVLDTAERILRRGGGDDGGSAGPFFCGPVLSAADVTWAPLLERYAAQLPCLHRGLRPRGNDGRWPRLDRWYSAMDAVPAYACRIRGDAPSWQKVLHRDPWWPPADLWHPRDTVGPKGELLISEAECAEAFGGTAVTGEVWARYAAARPHVASSPAGEAAVALVRNRREILADAARWAEEVGYVVCSVEELDMGLQTLAWILSGGDDLSQREELLDSTSVVLLSEYLNERLCVPRDMGAPAAAAIRELSYELSERPR